MQEVKEKASQTSPTALKREPLTLCHKALQPVLPRQKFDEEAALSTIKDGRE